MSELYCTFTSLTLLGGSEAAMARAESAHLPPGNPALDSWSQHRMWAGVGSLLVLMGFSPGTLGFSYHKTYISQFQCD